MTRKSAELHNVAPILSKSLQDTTCIPQDTCIFTRNDILNITLLLLLYIIQGIPLGIRAAIPLVIHKRVTYSQLGFLSITTIPFCLKLLWAPILDSLYIRSIGKRKTWLIPTQLLCGFLLWYCSLNSRIDCWIGENGSQVQIAYLFTFFMLLHFLVATQDIAVDGWALTMLRPGIRVHASTCNVAGQSFGVNLAYIGFITLNDRNTCIRLYRAWIILGRLFGFEMNELDPEAYVDFIPFVSLSGFIKFFGIAIIVSTLLISLKCEYEDQPLLTDLSSIPRECRFTGLVLARQNIVKSYTVLGQILKLKPVQLLCFVLLTKTVFFAPEIAADLKYLERGMPKDTFALVKPLMIPIEIIGPAVIAMFIHSNTVARISKRGMIARITSMAIYVCYVFVAGLYFKSNETGSGLKTTMFYGGFFIISLFHKFCCLVIYVADMSLFAKVSDPYMGGTYMSLFNTISNFGNLWSQLLGLTFIDSMPNSYMDCLYIECICCLFLACFTLSYFVRMLERIELYDLCDWYVSRVF